MAQRNEAAKNNFILLHLYAVQKTHQEKIFFAGNFLKQGLLFRTDLSITFVKLRDNFIFSTLTGNLTLGFLRVTAYDIFWRNAPFLTIETGLAIHLLEKSTQIRNEEAMFEIFSH